jgi:isocitrate/isopropylmalate dehydrogenase
MAMILAAGSLLAYSPEDQQAYRASEAIQGAVFDTVRSGTRTVDIGGQSTTTQFTDAVIARTQELLAISF